jgi:2-polyprenyl-3-methyl-5-hydroxy-6-metoxy-1,4-benzoquinol methylase
MIMDVQHNYLKNEKERQEQMPWRREEFYYNYGSILGYYQALSAIENTSGQKVLDLACCDGILTSYFAKSFQYVVGVDASSQCLKKARELNPNVTFHEAFIEELELREKFDGIYMLNLLEHVMDPVEILKKAASFLEEDGVLIVHVPNAEAINRKIALKMGALSTLDELSPFDIDVAGHRRCYSLKSLSVDILNAGLKIIKTGGIFYKMLSMVQMDWFLEKAPWETGGFGWGRVDKNNKPIDETKDWRAEFCKACYEIGKEYPHDCNIIYAVIGKGD